MPPVPGEILDRSFADMRPFLEYCRWLGFRPQSIVDVGANRGEWSRMAADVFPDAEFLLVEPQREMAEPLATLTRSSPRFRLAAVAAGAEDGEGIQTIWDDLEGSSFLPPVDPDALTRGGQRRTPIRRLDGLLAEWGRVPDLVKLDVEGFELEVLAGAPSIFGTTELLVLETSLYRFHEGQPLLREIVDFLAGRGYEMFDLAGRVRRPVDGALALLDVAFVRARGQLRQHDRW